MSGHNKWAKIKRKKGANDAARGKVFSKILREISIAVRIGGGPDPAANARLRSAILRAKDASLPGDTLQRAIERAAGGEEGVVFEDVVYEGYAPGGVAVLVEAQTDNRNRTTAEIRHVFTKVGGSIGTTGCVAFLFAPAGMIRVEGAGEDALLSAALDAGAEDVISLGEGSFAVRTATGDVHKVAEALRGAGFSVAEAEATRVATTASDPGPDEAKKVVRLVESLEELDDVQNVHTNLDDKALALAAE